MKTQITYQQAQGRTGHILKDLISLITIGEYFNLDIIPPFFDLHSLVGAKHRHEDQNIDEFDLFRPYRKDKYSLEFSKVVQIGGEHYNGVSTEQLERDIERYIDGDMLIGITSAYRYLICELQKTKPDLAKKIINNLRISFYGKQNAQPVVEDYVVIHARREDLITHSDGKRRNAVNMALQKQVEVAEKLIMQSELDIPIVITTQPEESQDVIDFASKKGIEVRFSCGETLIKDILYMAKARMFFGFLGGVSWITSYLNPNIKINCGIYHYAGYDETCFDFGDINKQEKQIIDNFRYIHERNNS